MAAKPNYAFVLCAGFGTRMGAVGKELPKPLWPLFGTTILGHLLNQLIEKDFKAIFVNAHHQADQVINYIKKHYPAVEVLREEPILDSGGALVQCAKHIGSNQGQLFSFNGDNVIDLTDFSLAPREGSCTLFSETVAPESHYNRLLVKEGVLREIIPAASERRTLSQITYAGISIFNLSFPGLWQETRPLGIFKDLLDFSRDQVKIESFSGAQVDLGSALHYQQGLIHLLSHYERWGNFLQRYCGLEASKLNLNNRSYNAPNARDTFNFTAESLKGEMEKVIVLSRIEGPVENSRIYWQGKAYPLV